MDVVRAISWERPRVKWSKESMGPRGLVTKNVRMVLRSPVTDVEGLYGVFPSVTLP